MKRKGYNWQIATFFWLFFMLASQYSFAQQRKIQGTLKTQAGTPVAHATVLLKHAVNNKILTFTSSNASGRFELATPDSTKWEQIILEVNHLGYAKISTPLKPAVSQYDLALTEQAINLQEIQVRNRPRINAAGDTLKYDVGSFARAEDRSIGDVLKRMPGMEVSESGQIKYNDKPISKFYIDGDDLLADKYAIGTKTIPHNMVERLEVLQNHQPLKVLRDKTLSDQIAINLVIKDEAKLKLTGQAKLGAGLPSLYDAELNTILFNKTFKMLNVGKGNNIGADLATDFNSLFSISSASRPPALLSAGLGGPQLPKNRYYMNNSGSLNANNLMNLRNGIQLKTNVHAWIDNQELNALSETEIYSLGDTIRIREDQQLRQYPWMTELTLSANANKDTYYFKNDFKLNYKETPVFSNLSNPTLNFSQRLDQRVREFSNDFQFVPELKNKQIINLSWLLSYYAQPQNLWVEPGLNEQVLNGGVPFDKIHQHTEIPTWFSRFSAGFQLPRGVVKQNYRLAWTTEHQNLQSALRLTQLDGAETPYAGSEDNDLLWNRNEIALSGNYDYKKGRWEASLSLPLTAQLISYQDDAFDLDVQRNRLLFSPNLRAKFMTTSEDYISFNYRFGEQVGGISNVYRGAVLRGHRSLQANRTDLQESGQHSANLHYNYQRSISMLFMNAGVYYNRSLSNSIASSIIDQDISQTIYIPFDNDVSSYGVNGGLSKYIFALGATTGLKASWGIARANQFLNGEAYPTSTETWTLSPNVDARLWRKVSMNYQASANWMVSRSDRNDAGASLLDRKMQRLDQDLSLNYSPKSHMFFRLSARNQYVEQPGMKNLNYTFLDAKLRYTFIKQKIDVDLDVSNLANIRRYESYFLSANQQSYSVYDLRGRMAILKVSFNL